MAILLYLFLCITAGILVYVATKKISLALLTVVVLLILTYLGVILEYGRF
tara:strand:- start:370 stop:519 length:150 start_codon:yes stop_codon:yes gene_type:complete